MSNTTYRFELFVDGELDSTETGLTLEQVWYYSGLEEGFERDNTIRHSSPAEVEEFETSVQRGDKAVLTLLPPDEIRELVLQLGLPSKLEQVVTAE